MNDHPTRGGRCICADHVNPGVVAPVYCHFVDGRQVNRQERREAQRQGKRVVSGWVHTGPCTRAFTSGTLEPR